jgi:hypothetical protein
MKQRVHLDFCRAMRAFSPALFVISNDISSFKNLSPDVVTATRNVRKTLYTFMQVFLCKNTRNALLLANDMDRFVEALGLNPEIGTMSAKVSENIANTISLCYAHIMHCALPDRFVRLFVTFWTPGKPF